MADPEKKLPLKLEAAFTVKLSVEIVVAVHDVQPRHSLTFADRIRQ